MLELQCNPNQAESVISPINLCTVAILPRGTHLVVARVLLPEKKINVFDDAIKNSNRSDAAALLQ